MLSATLGDDGSVGAWNTELALPYAVETHATFIHGGDNSTSRAASMGA